MGESTGRPGSFRDGNDRPQRFVCDLGHEHRTQRAADDCKRRWVNRKLYGPNYRGRRR